MNPELIKALTPIAIAGMGFVIAIATLLTPDLPGEKWTAGFGLATACFAGAAGLAESRPR